LLIEPELRKISNNTSNSDICYSFYGLAAWVLAGMIAGMIAGMMAGWNWLFQSSGPLAAKLAQGKNRIQV
jgi:hypothetical protein